MKNIYPPKLGERRREKIVSVIALLFIITGLFLFRVKLKWLAEKFLNPPLPKAINFNNELKNQANLPITVSPAAEPTKTTAPENNFSDSLKEYNLNVPFTMQAPFSDWSEPWQNTCEEANILMVRYYYENKTFTKDIVKDELLKLIDWQNKNFGSYVDTTIKQTAEMIEKIWNYKTEVIDNPTVEQIKNFITEGVPVIIPTAGRELKNPYFSNLGPIYHMVTVKGYTTDGKFITNDPGIGRGHNYLYDPVILMNAMHDWNGNEENILQGAKRILIIYPK